MVSVYMLCECLVRPYKLKKKKRILTAKTLVRSIFIKKYFKIIINHTIQE